MTIFDLTKRQETVRFVLEKRNLKVTPVMRVGAAFDVSGSAQTMYEDGTMQSTIDRLLPIAMQFDDNGEMDAWVFDDKHSALPAITKMDYEDFIVREILANNHISKWGGTSFGNVWKAIVEFYSPSQATSGWMGSLRNSIFGKKISASAESEIPGMVLFLTDGANNDREYAESILKAAQDTAVYFQLIGVGNPSQFWFLKKLANELPNVGFVSLANLQLTDDQLYDALLTDELVAFVKKFKD